MPGRAVQAYKPSVAVVASPAAAAETIIGQLAGIDTIDADSVVTLQAQCNVTVGTNGTAIRLRVRRDGVAGTLVGDTGALTGGIAAAVLVSQDLLAVDSPGAVASQLYVFTLQVTAASAISTVSAVVLAAYVS